MSECRFDNRVAVVTGAGRGLGRAHAMLLASLGAKVVVNDTGSQIGGGDIDATVAEDVVREIKAAGGEAVAVIESVATPAGGNAIIQAAMDTYGRIDVLIHNAGNVRRASLLEMTCEDFDAVLNVHLHGAFYVVSPAFKHMHKARYGRIVLTSSDVGLYGRANVSNYATAKAGMIGLSNTVAIEGGPVGVKCNAFVPAAITRLAAGAQDTTGLPKTFEPESAAITAGWLAHESCSISGQVLLSIGGRIAKAYTTETPGVFRDDWTIEKIGEQMDAIQNNDEPVIINPFPTGHDDHINYSYGMIQKGLGLK